MSTSPRRLGAVACAAVAALAIAAGCGDDGDDSLSRTDFLAQGNEICTGGNARIAAAVPTDGPPTGAAGRRFYDTIVRETQGQIDELAALPPPPEMESDVDAPVDEARAALAEVESQGPQAFFAADDDLFEGVNARARAIGLEACAS